MITIFEQYDLIQASGFFDADFYIKQNPDVEQAGLDPLQHYLDSGAASGRNPSSDFDSKFYLEQCEQRGLKPDNPLLHYLLEGRSLGLKHRFSSVPTPSSSPKLRRLSAMSNKTQRRTTARTKSSKSADDERAEKESKQLQSLLSSGLFDPAYYAAAYGLEFESDHSALEHFFHQGYIEGKRPNFYFDPVWYLDQNLNVGAAGMHPLFHYLVEGDAKGRQPSLIFDPGWYRQAYDLPEGENALVHYLAHCKTCTVSPLPEFDVAYYGDTNLDVKTAGVDPFAHFIQGGFIEGRNPSAQFNLKDYAERFLGGALQPNAFLHFLQNKQSADASLRPACAETLLDPPASAEVHPPKSDKPDDSEVLQRVSESGLFDPAYYAAAYELAFDSDRAALEHFFFKGYLEGKRPNFYFDPTWYLEKNPDVRAAGVQPLFHYLMAGDSENRRPSPIFDTTWYRSEYQLPRGQSALGHYLAHRTSYRVSPLPEFDVDYYGEANPDVKAAGVDPFEQFLQGGFREGRNPSRNFNVKYYAKRYLGGQTATNPFIHYLEHKQQPGIYGSPEEAGALPQRAVKQFTSPAPEFEDFKPLPPSCPRKAKILAYYLPQFHTFAENDELWGPGFTEWTNIARGVSRFAGHYQPRVPRDLGFYSLQDALPTLRRQIEMAKGGGVHGFVFYYYWFGGRRLMEKPINQFVADPSLEMPFCLMWANENWTRRWDGAESELLISQDHDPKNDKPLIEDLIRHIKDPRYIRVNGRPLLMIYRAGIIPDAKASVSRWRAIFKKDFNENPIFVMAQTADDIDPTVYGMDGAIEFPPHKLTANMDNINDEIEDLDIEFSGDAFSYQAVVDRSLDEPASSFPLIKTAVPSWDNDARRQGSGLLLKGSKPEKYEAWLRKLVDRTEEHPFFGERLVCVNAWNEWCEAAYLEPDLHYGSAYLNATSRAVAGEAVEYADCKLLLIGHDAFPSGSQHLLLNIARHLKSAFGLQLEFLLLNDGKLRAAYEQVAPVALAVDAVNRRAKLRALKDRGYSHAIVNTMAAAHVLADLQSLKIDAITLVHEMPGIVREKGLLEGAKLALTLSRHVIFPARIVRELMSEATGVEIDDRMLVMPQGLYKKLVYSAKNTEAVKKKLGISTDEKLVIGIGYADSRKGFDLFLQLWKQLQTSKGKRRHFCWIGDIDPETRKVLTSEIKVASATGTFHLPGYRDSIDAYVFAADAFALTSREDPFPTVIHEALSAGLPVFAFSGSGGMSDLLVEKKMGTVVASGDVLAMAKAISATLAAPASAKEINRRKAFVSAEFDFGKYVRELLALALPQLVSVSVAVPNYNYARFISGRLGTIFQQSYPVHEVIVLDDCSTDDSLSSIPRVASEHGREVTLIPNAVNSGSVFAQWRKAVDATTGDLIWIAEADDLSAPKFLATVVQAMQADSSICLGFTDSRSINDNGSPLSNSYKDYYSQEESGALAASATYDGKEFIRRFLSVRNLILNVSSVVWRREILLKAMEACDHELKEFKLAGDWRVYLEALSKPGSRIAYVADPLNVHRRHAAGLTQTVGTERLIAETARCHEVASRYANLSAAVVSRQNQYLNNLTNLEESVPDIVRNHFDRDFYLESYEDVRNSGVDPVLHYLTTGFAESRDPSPDFETEFYLKQYPDVEDADIHPYLHYLKYGKAEGRLGVSPALATTRLKETIARIWGLMTSLASQTTLATLLKKSPVASTASSRLRGNVEAAFTHPQTGDAVIVGWTMHDLDAPVWLENENGDVFPLNNAFRVKREDVVKAFSALSAKPIGRPGFLAHVSGVSIGARVSIKAIDDDGIHTLADATADTMANNLMDVVHWLASIGTALPELSQRIPLVDEPILRPLLTARTQAWKYLPITEKCLGSVNAKPLVSIVIPLYGRIDFVEHQLIEFAKDPWIKAHAEVIYVVDDPALVDSLSVEANHLYGLYQVPFRWVFGEVNRGFSGANNLGVELSKAEFLLFLNSDAFPRKPGWCNALIEVLQENPKIGAVGPRLLFADGSIQHCGMEYRRREDLGIWTNHHPNMGLDPSLDPLKKLTSVPGITGACLMMRRTDFDAVGGWDTGYLIGDFEDSDLCLKLRSQGYEIGYLPDVELTHLERQSFKLMGEGEFRTRVVIYNAVRHQTKWKKLLEGMPANETGGH